jgi:hypothetical protein
LDAEIFQNEKCLVFFFPSWFFNVSKQNWGKYLPATTHSVVVQSAFPSAVIKGAELLLVILALSRRTRFINAHQIILKIVGIWN